MEGRAKHHPDRRTKWRKTRRWGGRTSGKETLPPNFLLFSFYALFFPFLFCCFHNPSSLKTLHVSLHVTSVFPFNPVKFTVVLFSHNRLLKYPRR